MPTQRVEIIYIEDHCALIEIEPGPVKYQQLFEHLSYGFHNKLNMSETIQMLVINNRMGVYIIIQHGQSISTRNLSTGMRNKMRDAFSKIIN